MKISIVVPIFNVEKYLHRCIRSLCSQVLDNFEIILVNDGSTDSSGEIADYYSNLYKHVKVIHKDNGGVSSARNAGLEMAKGEYIWFVDADDWIEPDSLTRIWSELGKIGFNTDLFIFGYNRSDEKTNISFPLLISQFGLFKMNLIAFFEEYYFNYKLGFNLWNKLYRTEVIKANKLLFDNDESFGEDLLFNLYCYPCVSNVYFSQSIYYNYFIREGSAERTPSKNRHRQQMRIYNKYLIYLKEKELLDGFGYSVIPILFFIHLVSGIRQSKLSKSDIIELESFIRNPIEKRYFKIIFSRMSFYSSLNKWLKFEKANYLSKLKYNAFGLLYLFKLYRSAANILII